MKRNPPFTPTPPAPSSQNLKGIKARHLECTPGPSIGCMKFLFPKEFVTVYNRSKKCEGLGGGINEVHYPRVHTSINNLSFHIGSEGSFPLSCKQCATFVFNTLIIYHFVLGVNEASLLSLPLKQCATFIFNILVFYHSLLGMKELSTSLTSSVF